MAQSINFTLNSQILFNAQSFLRHQTELLGPTTLNKGKKEQINHESSAIFVQGIDALTASPTLLLLHRDDRFQIVGVGLRQCTRGVQQAIVDDAGAIRGLGDHGHEHAVPFDVVNCVAVALLQSINIGLWIGCNTEAECNKDTQHTHTPETTRNSWCRCPQRRPPPPACIPASTALSHRGSTASSCHRAADPAARWAVSMLFYKQQYIYGIWMTMGNYVARTQRYYLLPFVALSPAP
jgi:hypothetical protein